MPISHIIAHHLSRNLDSEAKLSLRSEELDVDAQKDQLLQQLKSNLLSRIARKHGSFSSSEQTSLLQKQLHAMHGNNLSFVEASQNLMQAIAEAVNQHKVDLNAHFLFFMEQSELHHVYYIFVVSQNQGQTISEALDVIPSYFIDMGASLFGVKVDIAEWLSNSQYAYLTVLSPRGNAPFAEFFDAVVGFANGVNKEESTLAFLEGVESFVKHVPEEKVAGFRAQVVDYCLAQDKKDEPVNIPGLAKTLDGIDCGQFVREMCSYNPKSEEDVLIDRKSLQRYVKFYGRDKDLSISFSTFHLNSRVHYDMDRDVLTIEGLPKSLKNQLIRYLGEM